MLKLGSLEIQRENILKGKKRTNKSNSLTNVVKENLTLILLWTRLVFARLTLERSGWLWWLKRYTLEPINRDRSNSGQLIFYLFLIWSRRTCFRHDCCKNKKRSNAKAKIKTWERLSEQILTKSAGCKLDVPLEQSLPKQHPFSQLQRQTIQLCLFLWLKPPKDDINSDLALQKYEILHILSAFMSQ